MILLFNALSHFLVDAVCLATLFGAAKSGTDIAVAVLIYNTLAFTTQCLTGWLVDRPGLARLLEAPSMLLVTAGYFLPGPLMLHVCLIGLGNSFFHVCGGRVTLEKSQGKAAPLGVFVAPGALGVAIGKCWPQLGAVLSVLLILMAGAVFLAYRKEPAELFVVEEKRRGPFPLLPVAALTIAVAVRAIGGCAAVFPWNTGIATAVATAVFVFAGKTAGGFLCDRTGALKTSAVSILPAAVLTAFAAFSMGGSLLGQFLLNLSMPVTLWLLYRLLPDEPGFAFGLAASALWPGTLLGQLIQLTGAAQKALILFSFLLGLVSVWYSVIFLKKKGDRP